MTLTARLAKVAVELRKRARQPHHFGLTPEEFHRQTAILIPLFDGWFGDSPAPECPEGIAPELHQTFIEICLTV